MHIIAYGHTWLATTNFTQNKTDSIYWSTITVYLQKCNSETNLFLKILVKINGSDVQQCSYYIKNIGCSWQTMSMTVQLDLCFLSSKEMLLQEIQPQKERTTSRKKLSDKEIILKLHLFCWLLVNLLASDNF